MAHYFQHNIALGINPPPPAGVKINVIHTPQPLQQLGMNMMVEISTATAFRQLPLASAPGQPTSPVMPNTIAIMAHLDTGASRTSIDNAIAQQLGLVPTGMGNSFTAAGPHTSPNYAIDLAFIGTQLRSLQNLESPIDDAFLFDRRRL